jgi:hypothetical protein
LIASFLDSFLRIYSHSFPKVQRDGDNLSFDFDELSSMMNSESLKGKRTITDLSNDICNELPI